MGMANGISRETFTNPVTSLTHFAQQYEGGPTFIFITIYAQNKAQNIFLTSGLNFASDI